MKTIHLLPLLGVLTITTVLAAEEPTTPTPAEAAAVVAGEAAPAEAPAVATNTVAVAEPPAPEPPILLPNGEPGLRMNFRGVPLEQVLNYLSDAAGFIIILDTKITGKFDAWSNQPLSKEEAVDLLNTVLNKNGYAAIRRDRTLTIVNRDEVKTRDIPVILESDPNKIPKTDEIVTQIITVRFVEVAQLLKDIQPLVSLSTTITANEAGNSIIITDTRANINRVAQIIKAVDMGAENVTEVRVFPLEFADPTEMAALLTSLYADDGQTGGQNQGRGGQRGGGGGGGFREFFRAAGGGGDAGGQNQRIKSRTKVTAVADPRTSSVIVTAAMEMMAPIEEMVKRLDANPAKKQKVYVYQVDPGDVTQVQSVLKEMFETTSNNRNTRNNNSLQNNVLQNRATQNQNSSASTSALGGGQNRQRQQ
jgi:type II secretory pathway component GspD/PulD (secretin)